MASSMIQVTPEMLRSKAGEVRNYRGQHDDTMARIKNLVYALNEIWKGEGQDAFLSKYESMQPTFSNFSELLETYAKLMDVAANDLESTDQSLKAKINNTFS